MVADFNSALFAKAFLDILMIEWFYKTCQTNLNNYSCLMNWQFMWFLSVIALVGNKTASA